MFYQKLANEYSSEANDLKDYIQRLKKKYSQELKLNDFKICRRLSILYEMYLDLKHMGNLLRLRDEFYGKAN